MFSIALHHENLITTSSAWMPRVPKFGRNRIYQPHAPWCVRIPMHTVRGLKRVVGTTPMLRITPEYNQIPGLHVDGYFLKVAWTHTREMTTGGDVEGARCQGYQYSTTSSLRSKNLIPMLIIRVLHLSTTIWQSPDEHNQLEEIVVEEVAEVKREDDAQEEYCLGGGDLGKTTQRNVQVHLEGGVVDAFLVVLLRSNPSNMLEGVTTLGRHCRPNDHVALEVE